MGGALLLSASLYMLFGRIGLFALNQAGTDGLLVEARAGQGVEQSFLSHYPGLAQISVRPADAALPDQQITVLRLREEQPGAPNLLTLQKSVGEIRYGEWLQFTFTPLDDTAERRYIFAVEPAGDAPVRLLAHRQNMYPEGELRGGGDLIFRIGYNGPAMATVQAFLRRVTEHKPGIFGQAWFYVVLLGANLVALVGAALAVTRPRED